ncbi:serine/threonine-protein kinase [Actinoplanes tereljensis]|uniref:non-specific serine/threonine protein kinase n=1 Tax=Paractinoplanes tereljensis TaxID=571912 RepID=A0A919NVW1_9ACTN|nr:serine/threonine-protein kinase [Actinoplanes tereljensis]GIF26259.1 putative serine/threonine-protein kinase PknA [Actinoplanes tereljensis]
MLSAGNVLGNRYRLDERIATGGMGEVWRGTDVILGRVIAVKVLKTAMLADPEFAARFYGEARMMASFRHPGVVEVYDYAGAGDGDSDADQVAYLVMAYVEGEPLSARVRQGTLPVEETMSIVAQAADALHAAHEVGVVHRDVKPGNLIVKPTGAVVLVDFGVARSAAVTSVTQLNAIVGTALYMAPEQVAKGKVTAATDIYALGAVAYHCIAGNPPFDGDNALQVALRHLEDEPEPLPAHVPPAVRDLIARAMAKQPADRFETAAEFAAAAYEAAGPLDWKRMTGTSLVAPLSPAAPTRTVPVPRDMPLAVPRPVKRPQRSQTALLAAIVVMAVLAVGLTMAILFHNTSDNNRVQDPITVPSAEVDDQTEDPLLPAPGASSTRPSVKPNAVPRSSSSAPSASVSTSATPSVSATPTTTAPTTPPTTAPTTAPTTEPTTTPPTTEPTTTPPGTGAGAGTG